MLAQTLSQGPIFPVPGSEEGEDTGNELGAILSDNDGRQTILTYLTDNGAIRLKRTEANRHVRSKIIDGQLLTACTISDHIFASESLILSY